MYRRERSKRSRLTLCLRWVCLVCWRFCSGAVAGVSWMWIRTLWVRCCQDGRFCYLNSSKSCRWGDMCTIMWKRREWWGVMKCRTMKGTPLILPIYRRSREEWVVCWEEWCHHCWYNKDKKKGGTQSSSILCILYYCAILQYCICILIVFLLLFNHSFFIMRIVLLAQLRYSQPSFVFPYWYSIYQQNHYYLNDLFFFSSIVDFW